MDFEDINNDVAGENKSVVTVEDSEYWQTEFSDSFLHSFYKHHGIAGKAADKFSGDLASEKYKTNNSLFEKIRKELRINKILSDATLKAYVFGEAMIYMAFNDSADYNEEYIGKQVPDFIKLYPKSWFELDDYGKIAFDENDCVTMFRKDGTNTFKVHKSRFIHVFIRDDKDSFYVNAYRPLFTIDNILWSTGQSFYRLAAGLTHIKINNPAIVKRESNGRVKTEVDLMNENGTFNDLSSRSTIITDQKVDVASIGLAGSKMNPEEHWNVAIQHASMSLKVPVQMLIGENAGNISGSEVNQEDYFGEVQKIRDKFIPKYVNEFAEAFGLPFLEVEFEALFEESEKKKAERKNTDIKTYKEGIECGMFSPESANKEFNEKYGTKLEVGSKEILPGISLPFIDSKNKLNFDKDKSKWEEPKYNRFLNSRINKFLDILDKELSFDNIKKKIKGSVFFDSFRKFNSDDENAAYLEIEKSVNVLEAALTVYLYDEFANAWALGLTSVMSDIYSSEIIKSNRAREIEKAMQTEVMSLVTGATEEMKKDLRFQLQQALINEESPRRAAKRFEDYVSADFSNKYKNRLQTIAENEMMRGLNNGAFNGMRDAGIKKVQWITAGDERVRDSHRRMHLQIRNTGEKFSNGVITPPEGVNCRCSLVPYFD